MLVTDELLADSGCVYHGPSVSGKEVNAELQGLGSITHPLTFLSSSITVKGAWQSGQLMAREMRVGDWSGLVSVPEALTHCAEYGVCTYYALGEVSMTQHVFICDTCVRRVCDARRVEEKEGDICAGCEVRGGCVIVLVCHNCAVQGECHRGHVLIPLGRCNLVRCDCGRGQVSLMQPHYRRMMNSALARLPRLRSPRSSLITASSSTSLSSAFPPPPLYSGEGGDRQYFPDCVVKHWRQNKRYYVRVHWAGYAYSFDTTSVHTPSHTPDARRHLLSPPTLVRSLQ
jgi:hypothetical protein